jgi:hypothetical protein
MLTDLKTVQDDVKADPFGWCDSIENKMDTLRNEQEKILKATANFSEQANGLKAAAKEIETHMGKVTSATNKIVSNATPYCDALLGGTGRENREAADGRVLIDLERKAKQILIVIKDFDTAMLSTDTLMEKANGILTEIRDRERPETVKIEAITRFLNGGMLLQFNSKEATKWLRDPLIEDTFLKKFAKDAYVKEHPFNVLLRRVPIIFEPSNEAHLCEVEEANGLIKFLIIKARWIKPEGRRRKGQTHAHATAIITSANMVNNIIKGGLEICEAKLRPEKLRQELLQCLRCKRWGHFAINCSVPEDVCGTCGEAHRTIQCKNLDKKHCVSCNLDSHPSWDRNCLEFIRRCKIFDEKHPENNMVYFPTDEDWTLTTRPDRIPTKERFPQWFTVNSLPITNRKLHAKTKKPVPTKQAIFKDVQGKDQHTINHYFSCSQAKGKEKALASETGELLDADDYDECFNNIENNDVERLIGSIPI